MSALAYLTDEEKSSGKRSVMLYPLRPSEYEDGTVAILRDWLARQAEVIAHVPVVWSDGRTTVQGLLDLISDANDACFVSSENGALFVTTTPVSPLGITLCAFGEKVGPNVLSYIAKLNYQINNGKE